MAHRHDARCLARFRHAHNPRRHGYERSDRVCGQSELVRCQIDFPRECDHWLQRSDRRWGIPWPNTMRPASRRQQYQATGKFLRRMGIRLRLFIFCTGRRHRDWRDSGHGCSSPFCFKSVDLVSSTMPILYTIKGMRNSSMVFTVTDTRSSGEFRTVVNPHSADAIGHVIRYHRAGVNALTPSTTPTTPTTFPLQT
jgi:hypothetical protein